MPIQSRREGQSTNVFGLLAAVLFVSTGTMTLVSQEALGQGGGPGAPPPAPPPPTCGEPLYLDGVLPNIVSLADVRLTSSGFGTPGSRVLGNHADSLQQLPLNSPGGGFLFMDADGQSGWTTDDTLLWGPLQGLGSATAYVVLSTGMWPGLAGGYSFGALLDGASVTGLSSWGPGAFRFIDDNHDGTVDSNEPVYAVRGNFTVIQAGSVHMTQNGALPPGWVARGGDPDVGQVLSPSLELRYFDADSNGYFGLQACNAPPSQPTAAPPTPACGEPLYVDVGGPGSISHTDVRLTPSIFGAAGSHVIFNDPDQTAAYALQAPTGAFAFMDGDGVTGWSEQDTLLWGPLQRPNGQTAYAVLSTGLWTGQTNGYAFGTLLDGAGVSGLTAWPAGSEFRYFDRDGDINVDVNEPVYGSPAGITIVQAGQSGAVHMTDDGFGGLSIPPGRVARPNDGDTGRPLKGPFPLRHYDVDGNGFYDLMPCGNTSVSPVAACGEPVYIDLEGIDVSGAGVVEAGELRVTQSVDGLPGSTVVVGETDEMQGHPLVGPGGAFVYVDADGSPGWTSDDTLLWGPMTGPGSTSSYVVLSTGQWTGQTAGYQLGATLDSSSVTAASPWPSGSLFRYQDVDASGHHEPGEPVYALPGGTPTVGVGTVRLTPFGSAPAGWVVRAGDPDLAAVVIGDGDLRFFDLTGNAFYDTLACSSTLPTVSTFDPGTWPPPPDPLCGERLYVDLPQGGFLGGPDVRLTPHLGAPGTRADNADGTSALLAPFGGGGFVFVDATAPAGWGLGDTLLWGPMDSTSSSGQVYVVLSEGAWPGLPGGYPNGVVLDASGIATTTPWPPGSSFRFVDSTPDGQPDNTEPVFAVPETPGTQPGLVNVFSVRTTPAASQYAAGTLVQGQHDEHNLIRHADGYPLKLLDSTADALYTVHSCQAGSNNGTPGLGAVAVVVAMTGLAGLLRRKKGMP